jgi:hypothetical protein
MTTIVRMDKEGMVKRIRKRRRIAVRRIGKRGLRWEVDGVELGNMKIQNWSKMPIDREAWKRIVQQAKTHKELQRQEKKKKK